MTKLKKLLPSIHIPIMDLGKLSAKDLLIIDGPKFITSDSYEGARTFAVLISHDMWKKLNHGIVCKSGKRMK